ncbi:2295_t:CDS:2, partial [Cetraspora pellucida]
DEYLNSDEDFIEIIEEDLDENYKDSMDEEYDNENISETETINNQAYEDDDWNPIEEVDKIIENL